MSAPVDQASFFRFDDPLTCTASLWRGAMIERYARTEHYVLRSIRCLQAHQVTLVENALAPLPRSRLNALVEALRLHGTDPSGPAAVASLVELQGRWDERNALSHGRFEFRRASVVLRWTTHEKAAIADRSMRLTAMDMLDRLASLDSLQRVLGSQLGQVDASFKRRAA